MKKKLIAAGAASLAVAAMPVVGVFADGDITSVTDTLEITVNATCTFNTDDSAVASDTTYSATVANGAVASLSNGSAHKFNVFCNDTDGWNVTAGAPSNLTPPAAHTTNGHAITYQDTAIPTAASGTKEGAWTATVSGSFTSAELSGINTVSNVNYIDDEGGIIATETSSTDASTFTVTYAAYVGTETAADVYTGTIGYTLAAL